MRLIAFTLEGYRRFLARTSIKLHGDTIAIVGPNEAGKSSLLRALAHLHSDAAFSPTEKPRRTSVEPKLSWQLQLEKSDKAAISGVSDSEHVERVVITKNADGTRSWEIKPRDPRRDKSARMTAGNMMEKYRNEIMAILDSAESQTSFSIEEYDNLVGKLAEGKESYTADEVLEIDRIAAAIEAADYEPIDDIDDDTARIIKHRQRMAAHRKSISTRLYNVARNEETEEPREAVIRILSTRLPRIEFFEDADRDLASSYDLREVAADPPRALQHIAALANLDLRALRREAEAQQIADVATRRNAANRELLAAFDKTWNQQGIAIQIDVQGTIVHIQATSPEDVGHGLSDINERSDGMRWFAALLAFSSGWTEGPILLVDEIEKHLHYDAQADLIAVLSKQEYTSKVIYTTHSFGCLPYDLGTGVRVVQPIDPLTSRLENGFWKNGAGFSPLLASMGAAAASFTPTRRALICEGASDAILLPSILRQVTGRARLNFQIAPGLSSVASLAIPELDLEAGRVGFIVDGDHGGRNLVRQLQRADVANDRIVVLEDPGSGIGYEIEDFIDSEVYVNAVNEELRCWNSVTAAMAVEDVSTPLRTKKVEIWCQENGLKVPEKVAVAQRVVNYSTEMSMYCDAGKELILQVYEKIQSVLRIAHEQVD